MIVRYFFRILAKVDHFHAFSRHTSVFLTQLLAIATSPAVVKSVDCNLLAVLIDGLPAMRDHSVIDTLLAFPCSYFADAMGCFVRGKRNFIHPPGQQ